MAGNDYTNTPDKFEQHARRFHAAAPVEQAPAGVAPPVGACDPDCPACQGRGFRPHFEFGGIACKACNATGKVQDAGGKR